MSQSLVLEGSIRKIYLKFVIPAVISMVIYGAMTMIDGLFLGNFDSSEAMAGINITNPFIQIILGSTMIIATGSVSYLGRTIGEMNYTKVEDIFKTNVISLLIISLCIAINGFIFADKLALLFGADDTLFKYTYDYIRIIALFAPSIAFAEYFGFTDRLLNHPEKYLIATIIALFTNIITDYVVIKTLHLSSLGAAIATGISYTVWLLVVIGPNLSSESVFNIYKGHYHFTLFKESAINGISEGATYVSTALAMYLFNNAFLAYAGSDGVAAFTIISYLGQFTTLLMFGISDGISSIVSVNYGARLYDRVRIIFYSAITINFIIGLISFGITNIYTRELISLFLKDNPEVLNIAITGAHIYSFGFLFVGFNIVQSGFQTAIGNAIESFIIALSRGIIFIFIGIMILPHFFSFNGVWMSSPFAEIMCTIIGICIILLQNELYIK